MADAIITKTGHVIRIKTSQYDITSSYKLYINGKLSNFKIGETEYIYCYQYEEPIALSSGTRYNYLNGYYNIDHYHEYKEKKRFADKIEQFNFSNYKEAQAQQGDKIQVTRRRLEKDFSNFYQEKYTIEYDGISTYNNDVPPPSQDSIYKNVGIYDKNSYFKECSQEFYKKHWAISDFLSNKYNAGESFPNILANIPYWMTNIIIDIFPLFPNTIIQNYETKESIISYWANIIYDSTNYGDTTSIGIEIVKFEDALRSFYNEMKLKRKAIENNKDIINYLIEFAKITHFNILQPLDLKLKIKLLIEIAKGNITEENSLENVVLKILKSVTTNQNTEFLDALLNEYFELENIKIPLFEVLYEKMTDNRLERFTLGLLQTNDNKKEYIRILYDIWKKSKYNPYYNDSSYSLPPYENEVYPESPYMELIPDTTTPNLLKSKYYGEHAPFILPCELNSYGANIKITVSSDYKFKFINQVEKRKIEVEKVITETARIKYVKGKFETKTISLYGTYEIYQPITVIGFKPDSDLAATFSNTETNEIIDCVPIFLLTYLYDYKETKYLDFGIMLAVEIGLTLTQVGNFSKLRYLQYLSKARNLEMIKKTGIASSEKLLTWKAAQQGGKTLEITGEILGSMNEYIINTKDGPEEDAAKKMRYLFLALVGGSISFSYITKRRISQAADDLFIEVLKLEGSHIKHTISPDLRTVILDLKNGKDDLIILAKNKLRNQLGDQAASKILAKLDTYDENFQLKFFDDFYHETDPKKWEKLGKSTAFIDNWKQLVEKGIPIPDRRNIDDILANKNTVNAYLRYYDEPSFKNALITYSYEQRLAFMKKYQVPDDVFNKMKKIPETSIDLYIQALKNKNKTKHLLTPENAINLIKEGLPTKEHFGLISRFNKEAFILEQKYDIAENLSLNKMAEIYMRYVDLIPNKSIILHGEEETVKEIFLYQNRLYTEIKVYKNGQVTETILEKFISGTDINAYGPQIASLFTEPSNLIQFENFGSFAFTGTKSRRNDSEVKFVFNFFEKHLHKGDKFVIEMESTFYTCDNCNRLLKATKKEVESLGIELEFIFKSNEKAKNTEELRNLLEIKN